MFSLSRAGTLCHKVSAQKVNKKPSEGAPGEALASQLELDLTLITCMVSSMMGTEWYLDSGALFHMTDNKELSSNLEEKDLQMHMMGDIT